MRSLALALLLATAAAAADDLPAGVFARVGGASFQHPDRPLAFDFHPNGKHLASGGTDGAVRIWEVKEQRLLYTLSVKGGTVSAVRYTADGKSLFVHFGDEKLRRYDADNTYKLLDATAAHHSDHLSTSADGSLVCGLETSDKVKVLEAKTGLERLELPEGRAACLAPDGGSVAVVLPDNGVQVFEVPSGKPLHTFAGVKDDKTPPAAVAFSPDGKRLAVAPEWQTGRVRVYEIGKKEPVADFDGEGRVRFATADTVVARRRGRVVVFDVKTKAVTAEFAERVAAFAVSADGKTVATDNGSGTASSRVRLWDAAKGTEIRGEKEELRGVIGTAPGPDGAAWVATAGGLYSWKPGDKPVSVAAFPRPATAFAATSESVFVADGAGVSKLDAKKPATSTPFPAEFPKGVVQVAASADGKRVAAVATEPELRLVVCDGDGKDVRAWPLPSPVLGLAVRPDGGGVATLHRDGLVRAWDAGTDPKRPAEKWKVRVPRSLHGGIAYTPDGQSLVVAGMLKVLVLDTADGKQQAAYERTWDDGPFVSVAVSADGGTIAAGTLGTNGVMVIDRDSGTVVARQTGSKTALWHLSFSADARTLLACGGDDAVTAWDVAGRRGKDKPTADEVKAAWVALAGAPERAWAAAWVLADSPDVWGTVAGGLKTAHDIFDNVDKNAALLGDSDFATRTKAAKELLAAGPSALPAVKAVAEKTEVPETKRQADELIEKLTAQADDPKRAGGNETARLLRAVRLAERLGGAKGAETLSELEKFGGVVGKAAAEAKKRAK